MPKSIEKPIEDVDDLPLEAAALSALHSLRHDTTDFTDVSNDKANDNNNIEDEGISPPTTTTEPTGDEKTPYSDAPHTNTREASRKRNTPAAYNDSKTSKSVSKSTTPRKSDQPIDLAPQELGKYVRGLVAPPDTGIKEKARRDTSKVLSELAGQKKDDEEGKEGDEDITFDDSGGGFNDDEGVVNGFNESDQYIKDAIGEACPDDIAAEVHKRYPETKDREKAIDLAISRIEHLEGAYEAYNNSNDITDISHSLQGCNGLQNNTNVDCYMNSAMQILAHMDAITKKYLNSQFMDDLKDTDTKKNKYGSIAIELHKLLRRMHSGERNVSVKELKCAVDSCTIKFPLQQQHDCHEFLLYLLKALHLSTQKLKSCPTDVVDDEPSLISNLFLGEVCSTLECIECSKTSTTRFPEYGLLLQILPHAIGNPDALMICLDDFINTETLSRDNMINCGQSPSDTIDGICNTKRQVKKYLRFNPTPLMILTFKRNEYDSDTETTTKINDFLGFPLTLDMRSYVSSSDTNNNSLEYELQAVINHNGGPGCGHYYLYLKINGSWYEFDDSEVTQVNERTVCSSKEANTLVYCRSNEVENIMDQLNVRPRPNQVSTRPRPNQASTRPPSAPGRPPKRAAATRPQKKTSTHPPSASSRPERAARQKKTPAKTNVSASQQKKKRGSSNITAAKSSTASTRKKRKTAQRVESICPEISFGELRHKMSGGKLTKLCMVKVNGKECPQYAKGKALYGKVSTCTTCVKKYTEVSTRARALYGRAPKPSSSRKRKATAAPQNEPPPPPKSKRIQQKIENDTEHDDELEFTTPNDDTLAYFEDEFPDDMDILEERTKTKFGKTLATRYYCRNKLCKVYCNGKGGEKELCTGCATRVRQHRRKLELEDMFQIGNDFDVELAKINAQVHDSHSETYISIRQMEDTGQYRCFIKEGLGITGMETTIPSDSALVRQCLCILYDIDTGANMCRRNPLEDYLGKREKESEGVSDVPSVKEFFQELAFWLFNKYYDKYKEDEVLKDRLRTILGYLEDPTQLHKLWEGDKFEYQDINCAKEQLDVCHLFECLHSVYDENGHIRSTFDLRGVDHHQEKKRMIAAIDAISTAFKRDVEHHSRAGTSSWDNREDDVEEIINWLELQRDMLCCHGRNNGNIRRLQNRFNSQVQVTIDKITEEKVRAKTTREQNDTLHPAVAYAYEHECSNAPPDYEKYMKDIIGGNIKTTQNQYKQDIEKLQETAFYKKLKDAQHNNTREELRSDDISFRNIKLAYHDEKNNSSDPWFGDKFNGIRWDGVCTFTNEDYINARHNRPNLIGELYRRLLVRLAIECMMKGCSIKPSDYESAKSLYAFHLHHINNGKPISSWDIMRDIDKMSEEVKKNCVVFCAGCHNFKEQDNVFSIPLNKLQNQLIYHEDDEHVTGRQLVMDFDLIVVILKLFVMGGFRYGSVTRCTPDILRSIFYDHFGILFDDTVDFDVDDMFNNLTDRDDCKLLINSAILGALKKRSKRCADPKCTKRFMNISSFHSTVIHWDHTVDKKYEGAHLNHKQIVVLLNEVGRYLRATCAFCHGEQPRSCKERRTWGT